MTRLTGILFSALLTGCAVAHTETATSSLDICNLDATAPRQIGGLGARSDTVRTEAIVEYLDKSSCGPWYSQCGDNLLVITCGNQTERWSLDEASLVSGYHAIVQEFKDGQSVRVDLLLIGPSPSDP